MMHAPAPEVVPAEVRDERSSSTRLWAVPATSATLVVLPTYDECENIDTVLRRVRAAVPHAHVLVVDDNSPDGTADLADAVARELGGISVLRRPGPEGLGSAYRDGFRWGLARGYDVMVEMDADLSHDPAVLPILLRTIDAGADLVIGSRYVPGGVAADWPFARRAISRIGCRYAQLMLRLPTRDATSGYRAYRGAALRSVDLDTVRANGYGFQVEMAYRVLRIGGAIVEVPIEFRDRTAGTSKMSLRIVVEALVLVTKWGVRDRLLASGRVPARRRTSRSSADSSRGSMPAA
jgi:dolichol-phosphate mannosyltransferase